MKNKEKEKYRTYILAIKPYINYPALYKKTGVWSHFYRFPGGSSNTVSKKVCDGIMSDLTVRLPSMGYSYFERIKGVSEGMIEKINMADTQFER